MRVIVNADDLGMSPEVNDATFTLLAAGRITSATLMANAPAVKPAAAELRKFPGCSFGAHLNLTQFEPIIGGRNAERLTDARGVLSRDVAERAGGLGQMRAMYLELCAQVERLLELGVALSHLDSHHHVHSMPHVFPVVKAVQRRYRIRRLRLSKNLYGPTQSYSPALRLKKGLYNWAVRNVWSTSTTDVFTEFLTFHALNPAMPLPFRTAELMVHPGGPASKEETAVLWSEWRSRGPSPIELISYLELD
jgi:predicted glycoside hydrolase/deacetylase ChbG (UPF0249 family)